MKQGDFGLLDDRQLVGFMGQPTTPLQDDRRGCSSERWSEKIKIAGKFCETPWENGHLVRINENFQNQIPGLGHYLTSGGPQDFLEITYNIFICIGGDGAQGEKLKLPCG